jgi:tetratricopeptide (TPR) repeat protein
VNLREAIEVLEAVAAGPAPPPNVAPRLAEARTVLVRTLADIGNWTAAVGAGRIAVADWRALEAAHPGDADSRFGLACALDEWGRVRLQSGDALGAKESHLEAIALIESMPAEARANRDVTIELYNAHQYAGRGFELAGEVAAAVEQYRVAVEQATALLDANPKDIVARHQVSVVNNDWGRALRRSGRLAEASAAFERALALTEEVIERDPSNPFYVADLAACHAFLGRVHEMRRSFEAALREYRADVDINTRLVEAEPENGGWRGFLADALTNEGRVLMELGRLDDALARHQSALEQRRRALDSNPENAGALADVGESLLERGRVLERLARAEAAWSDWRQAVELLAEALRSAETSNARVRFARALLELGDVARARPIVERLLSEGSNEPELLAACERRGLSR